MGRKSCLAILLFASIVAMLPNSVLFPVEDVLATHLHRSISFVGWMITVYAILYVLATPVLGMISDFLGRKSVLILGLVLFAVGGLVPLCTTESVAILIGRGLMGFGAAGIQPMVDSSIGDLFEAGPKRRQAFAFFGAAIAVAEAFLPFFGGAIGSLWWKGVFLLYGTAFVSAVKCVKLPKTESRDRTKVTPQSYMASMKVAAKNRYLGISVFGAFVFGIGYFGVCALMPLALTGTHSSFQTGMLFLPVGLLWVIGSMVFARVPHVQNVNVLSASASILLAIATLYLGFVNSWISIYFISALWGIGSAVLTTLCTWTINDDSPEMVRGAMNGIYNAAYVLGFAIGAPMFLGLYRIIGLTNSAIAGAILMGLLAPFQYVAYKRKKENSVPTEPHLPSAS